jgi:hypothetical protein
MLLITALIHFNHMVPHGLRTTKYSLLNKRVWSGDTWQLNCVYVSVVTVQLRWSLLAPPPNRNLPASPDCSSSLRLLIDFDDVSAPFL